MCRATAGRLRSWLYDATSERVERGGLAALRRDLVGRAHGRTLEIVAGTGANVRFSPATASPLVLTDPDPHKLNRLRHHVDRLRPDAQVLSARAQSLPFPDAAFDTVVATLVLCSVPNQAEALAEVRRVLRPEAYSSSSSTFARRIRGSRGARPAGVGCGAPSPEAASQTVTPPRPSSPRGST